MKRMIIEIDQSKCDGCGLCSDACHEGAIGIIDGKAKLLRDDFCDSLGDCLPVCSSGAIAFVEREAEAYNETVVHNNRQEKPNPCGCLGSNVHSITRTTGSEPKYEQVSELRQWPVQIKLAPVNAAFFDGADLLVTADCAAYARADFHAGFMRGKVTLIGCPKLDATDYAEKLTDIIRSNNIKSLTIVRMEVPCCGGIEQAAVTALKNSGKFIPWQVFTLRTDGSTKKG